MINVAVIGASGYSGQELTRLLCAHPGVTIAGIFGSSSRDETEPYAATDVTMLGRTSLNIEPLDPESLKFRHVDAVFLATPPHVSAALAPTFHASGMTVFDLSGAFRLTDPELCSQWYDIHHADAELAQSAVYGLPEMNRSAIAAANLISCPGCYPTSVLIPFLGLRAAGLVDDSCPVIVDSASGVSGAGRTPSDRVHFCEVSFSAYGVTGHRHEPEMCVHGSADVHFTPHIGPWQRGILTTLHAWLPPSFDTVGWEDALKSWADAEPSARLFTDATGWPTVQGVAGTNFCDLRVHVDVARSKVTVISAIDNLVKGAAGQAVQCMNIRHGFDESTGLVMKTREAVSC